MNYIMYGIYTLFMQFYIYKSWYIGLEYEQSGVYSLKKCLFFKDGSILSCTIHVKQGK